VIASLPAVAGIQRVGPDFLRAFARMIDRLGWTQEHADMLASLMSHESGFRPEVINGIKAVGLIQLHPMHYKKWGYTAEQVAAMTATDQLELVERYLTPARHVEARDIPLVGLGWGVGQDDGVIVWSKDGTMGMRDDVQPMGYAQNPGLDLDKDGLVTLGEVRRSVAGPLRAAEGKPRVPIPAEDVPGDDGASGGGGLFALGVFGLFAAFASRLFRRRAA
jgi:hypothetical protein